MQILLWSGLFLYAVNYTVGWLLHFRIIRMTKRTHQILFAGIIINLTLLLLFLNFLSTEFFLCTSSLAMMVILPLGIKGGIYHRTVSTAGVVLYLVMLLL